MAKSTATTVEAYLDELPPDRRAVVSSVRDMILHHLPAGYHEAMNWGTISYVIPLERYSRTYNGQPLVYLALAAQKNHYALYLMQVYQDSELEQQLRHAFRQAGKRLDLGKSCLRFRRLDDLPLEALGEVVASTAPGAFIAAYEAGRQR